MGKDVVRYERMPLYELLVAQWVELIVPIGEIVAVVV
jgi:hypothetical protein